MMKLKHGSQMQKIRSEGKRKMCSRHFHSCQTGFPIFSDLSKMPFFLTFGTFFQIFSDLTKTFFLTFFWPFVAFSQHFRVVISVFLLLLTIFLFSGVHLAFRVFQGGDSKIKFVCGGGHFKCLSSSPEEKSPPQVLIFFFTKKWRGTPQNPKWGVGGTFQKSPKVGGHY